MLFLKSGWWSCSVLKTCVTSLYSRDLIAATFPLSCSWLRATMNAPVKQNGVCTNIHAVAQLSATKQFQDILSVLGITLHPLWTGHLQSLPHLYRDDCMLTRKQVFEWATRIPLQSFTVTLKENLLYWLYISVCDALWKVICFSWKKFCASKWSFPRIFHLPFVAFRWSPITNSLPGSQWVLVRIRLCVSLA